MFTLVCHFCQNTREAAPPQDAPIFFHEEILETNVETYVCVYVRFLHIHAHGSLMEPTRRRFSGKETFVLHL